MTNRCQTQFDSILLQFYFLSTCNVTTHKICKIIIVALASRKLEGRTHFEHFVIVVTSCSGRISARSRIDRCVTCACSETGHWISESISVSSTNTVIKCFTSSTCSVVKISWLHMNEGIFKVESLEWRKSASC